MGKTPVPPVLRVCEAYVGNVISTPGCSPAALLRPDFWRQYRATYIKDVSSRFTAPHQAQPSQQHTFGDCGVHLLTHDHNDCDHDIQGRPLLNDGNVFAQYDASTQGEHHGCVVLAEELELVAMPVLPHIEPQQA